MKAPAFQFYPADWQRDLSEHTLEIEGAWIRICCALWWSETPGKSTKPLTNWARVLRVGERKCKTIIDYLLNQNIAEVDIQNQSITITSRRMVKDEYIRNIRRNAGQLGGNPSLKKPEEKPVLDKQSLVNQKPTPSSSSSSSTTKNKHIDVEIPSWINKPTWDAFIEMRKSISAKPTPKAMILLIAKLERLRNEGNDPQKVLEQSIMNNYKGIFPLKEGGNGNGIRTARSDPRDKNLQSREDAEVAAITAKWEAAKKAPRDHPRGDAGNDDAPDFSGVSPG